MTEICPKCKAKVEWVKHKEFICKDRIEAIKWAKNITSRDDVVYLDLETTGLKNAGIVQIGLVDHKGEILMDMLINPEKSVEKKAFEVHGISNEMVKDASTFQDIYSEFSKHCFKKIVVIYNMAFDRPVIQRLIKIHKLEPLMVSDALCAMLVNAAYVGDWNDYHQSYKWPKLIGGDHSAAVDCQATRDTLIAIANTL